MGGYKFVKSEKGYRTEFAVSWEAGATPLVGGVEMRFPAGSASGTVEVRKYASPEGGERWGAFVVGEMAADAPMYADKGKGNTRDGAVSVLVRTVVSRAQSDTAVKHDPAAERAAANAGEVARLERQAADRAGKNCPRTSIVERRPLSRGEMGKCSDCGAVVRILAGGSLSPHRPGQSFGPAAKAWAESNAPTLPVVVETVAPVAPVEPVAKPGKIVFSAGDAPRHWTTGPISVRATSGVLVEFGQVEVRPNCSGSGWVAMAPELTTDVVMPEGHTFADGPCGEGANRGAAVVALADAVVADKAAAARSAEALRAKFGVGAKGEASKAADKARQAPAPAAPVVAKFPAALDALAAAPADRATVDRMARLAAAAQRAEAKRAKDDKRIGHDLVAPCTITVEQEVTRGRGSKKRTEVVAVVKKINARLEPGVYPVKGTETIDGKGLCPHCGAMVNVHESGKLSGHKIGGINPASVSPLPQRTIAPVGSKGEDARGADVARSVEVAEHIAEAPLLELDAAALGRMAPEAAKLAERLHNRAVRAREREDGSHVVTLVEKYTTEARKLAARLEVGPHGVDDFETDSARQSARARMADAWRKARAAAAVMAGERPADAAAVDKAVSAVVAAAAKVGQEVAPEVLAQIAADKRAEQAQALRIASSDGPALLPKVSRQQGGIAWAPDARLGLRADGKATAVIMGEDGTPVTVTTRAESKRTAIAGGKFGTLTYADLYALPKNQQNKYWRKVKAADKRAKDDKRAEREASPIVVVPGRVKGKKQHGAPSQVIQPQDVYPHERQGRKRPKVGARREGSALTHYGITVRGAASAEESRAAAGIAESGVAGL